MSINEQRAEWARKSLQVFADEVTGGEISAETVADLICNIGHYAKLIMQLDNFTIEKLFELAEVAWKDEDENSGGASKPSALVHLFSVADLK